MHSMSASLVCFSHKNLALSQGNYDTFPERPVTQKVPEILKPGTLSAGI